MAIAREDDASKGTAVAASTGHFFGFASGLLKPMAEKSLIAPANGKIIVGQEEYLVKKWSELIFSAPVKLDWLGHFLTGILGSVSSATVAGAQEHTITISNSGAAPAYTLFLSDAVSYDKATYGTVRKVELTCDAGGLLMANIEMLAQGIESGSGTVAHSTDHHLQGSFGSIKVAANISGISGASAVAFETMRLTIERDVTPVFAFGSTEPSKFLAGPLRISGELTISWEATTYRDLFQGDTDKALRIDFNDSATAIGTNTPELEIILPKIVVKDHQRPEGIDEPDMETITFDALYDLDESDSNKDIKIVLTNEETTTAYTEPA